MSFHGDATEQHEPAPGPGSVVIKYKCSAGHDHEMEIEMTSAIVACRTEPAGDEDVKIIIMGSPADHLMLHRAINHAMRSTVIPAMIEKMKATLKESPGSSATEMMTKIVDALTTDTIPMSDGESMVKKTPWPGTTPDEGKSSVSDPIGEILREIKNRKFRKEDLS